MTTHATRGANRGASPVPEAELYLVGDPRKCTGCLTCMLVCAVAHEGRSQLPTARIVVADDRFGSYPTDIELGTCRQCKDPSCVAACPTGALTVDQDHFNARVVERTACTGCRQCLTACHFSPSRMRFDPVARVSVKCDLCRDTPYWPHEKGDLACVEACPVRALASTATPPLGLAGYEIDLRGEGWAQLGLPTRKRP
jgi:protein NrfC